MKRILTLFGMVMGLAGGHEASAQPINYGIDNTSTQRPTRVKDKDEYADEAKARWVRLKKSFGERAREKDPFGSNMNPEMLQPMVIPVAALLEDKPAKPAKKIPLQEVVNKFKPNLISAAKQVVMVGSRFLKLGDPVQIEHEGVLFELRIVRISTNEVEFINTKNQEKATVRENEFDPSDMYEDPNDLKKRMLEDKGPLKIK